MCGAVGIVQGAGLDAAIHPELHAPNSQPRGGGVLPRFHAVEDLLDLLDGREPRRGRQHPHPAAQLTSAPYALDSFEVGEGGVGVADGADAGGGVVVRGCATRSVTAAPYAWAGASGRPPGRPARRRPAPLARARASCRRGESGAGARSAPAPVPSAHGGPAPPAPSRANRVDGHLRHRGPVPAMWATTLVERTISRARAARRTDALLPRHAPTVMSRRRSREHGARDDVCVRVFDRRWRVRPWTAAAWGG